MVSYLLFGGFMFKEYRKVSACLNNLQDDRNFGSHLSCNETVGELYSFAVSALNALRKFVTLDMSCETRIQYARKYVNKIDALQDQIDDEYRKSIVEEDMIKDVKKDVQTILDETDDRQRRIRWGYLVFNKYPLPEGGLRAILFREVAVEFGIFNDCNILAFAYFNGVIVEKDYDKAALYYEKQLDYAETEHEDAVLHIDEAVINLASIYRNGLCKNRSQTDADILLEKWKQTEHGSSAVISTYTKDGYEFYKAEWPKKAIEE